MQRKSYVRYIMIALTLTLAAGTFMAGGCSLRKKNADKQQTVKKAKKR